MGKICDILTHCKLISPLSSHSLRIIHFFIRKSFGIKKKFLTTHDKKSLKKKVISPDALLFSLHFSWPVQSEYWLQNKVHLTMMKHLKGMMWHFGLKRITMYLLTYLVFDFDFGNQVLLRVQSSLTQNHIC